MTQPHTPKPKLSKRAPIRGGDFSSLEEARQYWAAMTPDERRAEIRRRLEEGFGPGYWAAMTPEQRSAEMKRRLGLRRDDSNKKSKKEKSSDNVQSHAKQRQGRHQ